MIKVKQNFEQKIFLNTFYQVAGKLITSSLGLLASVLIARKLGVIGFGQYNLIFSFVGMTAILADFGLATLLIREESAGRSNENFFAGVFTLRTLFCLIQIILLSLVSLFLPYPGLLKAGIFFASISNLFLSLSSVLWAVFQAKLEFLKVVLVQVFSSLISISLVLLGFYFNFGLIYFVLATVLKEIGEFLISLRITGLYRKYFTNEIAVLKSIISEAWPLGLWAIVSTYYSKTDVFLLSLFYNPLTSPVVGFYSSAYKYFEVVGVFFGFFQMASFPVISSKLKEKGFPALFLRLTKLSLLIGIVSGVSLAITSKLLLSMLGLEFLPAVVSLRILSISLFLSVLAGTWISTAISGGKQKQVLVFSLVALIINFLTNLWVIPRFNYLGTSWTTVLTQLFVSLSSLWLALRVLKERKDEPLAKK